MTYDTIRVMPCTACIGAEIAGVKEHPLVVAIHADAQSKYVAGTLSNCCCDSTARDANMLGYKVLFLSDATAAVTDEEHNAALLNLQIMFADVRPTAEILEMIAAA